MSAAPAGYVMQNLGATTVTAIGSVDCAVGYSGSAYVHCDSLTSEFIFGGCFLLNSCFVLNWAAVTAVGDAHAICSGSIETGDVVATHSANGCSANLQASVAEATCAAAGARLCTLAELMTGQLSNTHCANELNVWTSDRGGCAETELQRVRIRSTGATDANCHDPALQSQGAICCAWAFCTQNLDPGYVSIILDLRVTSFDVSASCAPGYEGTAVVTSCATDGDYSLSGCAPIVCTSPASTVGYSITEEGNLDLSVGLFDVSVACAAGYEGAPIAVACLTDGPYVLSGCSPIVCVRPSATAGYSSFAESNLDLTVGSFDVSVACRVGWEGTAEASCITSGEYVLTGCSPIVCARPVDISGYALIRENNLDLSVGTFLLSAVCAAGYVSGNRFVGSASATACTTGLAEYTLSGCSACGTGWFKAGTGLGESGECEPCEAGFYNPSLGAAGCIGCPAGKYLDVASSRDVGDCIGCPAGKFVGETSSDEASDCIDCPAGQYSDVAVSISCIGCASGRYSALAGGDSPRDCIDCGAGTFSNAAGAASCYSCSPGTYSPGLTFVCLECARGRSDTDIDPATPCSSPVVCAAVPNEEKCLDEMCAWGDDECWTVDEALAKQREETRRMTFLGLALVAAGVASVCCCYYTFAFGRPKADPDKWAVASTVVVQTTVASAFSAGAAGDKAKQLRLRLENA